MTTPSHRQQKSSQAAGWRPWPPILGVLLLTSCATAVGVQRVDTQDAYRVLTANAVATGTASEYTAQVLSRLNLGEQFEHDPAAALVALHGHALTALNNDQVNNRLFALAELSFLHAEQQKQGSPPHCQPRKGWACPPEDATPHAAEQVRSYALAAAVYAYAFLFPETPEDGVRSPADPRLRLAYDLYNRGLTEGLTSSAGEEAVLGSGRYRLPFGEITINFVAPDFMWAGHRFARFVPTVNLAVRGLRNRYRRAGIGATAVKII
mgnify:CR=1 FL=1